MDFIKNLFGNKESTPSSQKNQTAWDDGRYWGGSPIALFLFNSDAISKQISTAYEQYAEGELLKSLGKALQPVGGWESLKSSLVGFHGDIGSVAMPGEPTPLAKLGSYLTNVAFGMSVTKKDLDPALLEQLKLSQEIKFGIYGVGVGIIPTKQVVHTHWLMKTKNIVGYLGLAYFDMDVRGDWGNIYKKLLLPAGMEIKGKVCTGWLAKPQDISEAGLRHPLSSVTPFEEDWFIMKNIPSSPMQGNLFWFDVQAFEGREDLNIREIIYSLFIPRPPLVSPKSTKGLKQYCDELNFYEGVIKPQLFDLIPCEDNQKYVISSAKNRIPNKILGIAVHGDKGWLEQRHLAVSQTITTAKIPDSPQLEYLGMTTFLERDERDSRLIKYDGSLYVFDGYARGVGLKRTLTLKSFLVEKHNFINLISDEWFSNNGYITTK